MKKTRKQVTEEYFMYVNGLYDMGYAFLLESKAAPKVYWVGRTGTFRYSREPELEKSGTYATVYPYQNSWEFKLLSGYSDSLGRVNKMIAIDLEKEELITEYFLSQIKLPEEMMLIWQVAAYLSYYTIPFKVDVNDRGDIDIFVQEQNTRFTRMHGKPRDKVDYRKGTQYWPTVFESLGEATKNLSLNGSFD